MTISTTALKQSNENASGIMQDSCIESEHADIQSFIPKYVNNTHDMECDFYFLVMNRVVLMLI